MRVIAGKARGTQLKTPEGMLTRPTADRVKEALFSIIQFDLPGAEVLDLFGGTGQLGIEAISRGAKRAVFVDMQEKACRLIRENLKKAHTVHEGQTISYIGRGNFALLEKDENGSWTIVERYPVEDQEKYERMKAYVEEHKA